MMGDPLDMKQIFFTNLQLLGLDAAAEGMDNKIPFNKNMFDLPNKRGSEVVLHFLFEKLNPVMCREEFRHCWPIIDKQQEAQFRRTCNNWLNNISKSEPDSHLPRITGSLFLSPGGDKFIQLLLYFSRYVLQQEIDKMGVKEKDCVRYPELTQQTASLGESIGSALQCSIVRNRKFLLKESQIILALNREWKEYANELVKDYRKLTKLAREKDHNIREEMQKATERGAAKGSPMIRKRRSSNSYEYDFDPQSIKRAQRVQEVRDLWKQFDNFCSREAAEREVIESIVDKTMNKYKISASDVNIKVPDLLLTECEEEIRRRHVDSNFHHGKLNLISIIQLWNLCLHLYIEKVHKAGVPKFDDGIKAIKDKVHTSHAYLSNTKALKEQISSILPELKESIDYLRVKVENDVSILSTPHSLRSTSVGLGLMEPSPPVSFTPGQDMVTPEGATIKISPEDVTTPEAVLRLNEDITGTIRKGPNSLFQGTPVYSRSVKTNDKQTSKLPRKATTTNSNARTVDVREQLHSTPTRGPRPTGSFTAWDSTVQQPETLISQMKQSPPRLEQSLNTSKSKHSPRNVQSFTANRSINKSTGTQSSGTLTPKQSPRSEVTTPRNRSFRTPEGSPGQRSHDIDPGIGQMSPSDIIADEVMGIGTVMSPVMSGLDAFKTKSEIPRSPIGMEVKQMFREAMSAENSPRSDRSRSSKGQRSMNNSLNLSGHSSLSQNEDGKDFKNYSRSRVYGAVNEFLSSDKPEHFDNEHITSKRVGNDLNRYDFQDNMKSSTEAVHVENRPISPVGQILDSYETEPEDSQKPMASNKVVERPPSPVAEVLESLEYDEDNGIIDLETLKENEEDEFYLEQPEDLVTSDLEDENKLDFMSKKLVDEQKAFITKEMIPRSPLKDEIRRMYKEAVSDVDDSPVNKSLNHSTSRMNNSLFSNSFSSTHNTKPSAFDFRGAGDGIGLEDIEMPDLSLNDSIDDPDLMPKHSAKTPKTTDKHSVHADLISFATPKSNFDLFQTYDAQRLEQAKHELDEKFSQSLPLRFGYAHDLETRRQLEESKAQMELLEKSIGDIEGKILELSSTDVLCQESKDDSDLIDNLDDSFAPLKSGFLVEGGTPKLKTSQNSASETSDTADIRARMKQLKEAASRIRSNYKH